MVRRILCGLGFTVVAVVLSASAATAADASSTVAVPQSVGFMPAAEAPPVSSESSPVPTLLEAGGVVLLAAGGIVIARSWVSPAQPV